MPRASMIGIATCIYTSEFKNWKWERRLKMNARLYDFPPIDEPGKRGRKKTKGAKLFNFKEMIEMPDLGWKEIIVEGYGKKKKVLKYISSVSLWGVDGFHPVPVK
jgi:hypothetical protein